MLGYSKLVTQCSKLDVAAFSVPVSAVISKLTESALAARLIGCTNSTPFRLAVLTEHHRRKQLRQTCCDYSLQCCIACQMLVNNFSTSLCVFEALNCQVFFIHELLRETSGAEYLRQAWHLRYSFLIHAHSVLAHARIWTAFCAGSIVLTAAANMASLACETNASVLFMCFAKPSKQSQQQPTLPCCLPVQNTIKLIT